MAESFISMRLSKDGGYTWNDWKTRSLGVIGSYAEAAVWRRLGQAEQFTFSFRADGVPDIVSACILGADGNWAPAPIAQGAYADHARLWTFQDTCNYIPVRVERPGATAEWILRGAPGYRLFANVGDGPIRGARDVEGKLLVVSGTEVYLVARDTSSTLLGTLPGEGPVTITHNQEGGGSKVVFANGTRGYTYDTITGTYAQITDEAFPGFLVCEYLDQYILGIEPQRRYAFHSDLADAREYSAIDVFEAEGAPDRLMGQCVIGGQWWLFGERTTEIFANTGAATGTFQRIPGATIDRGLASTHAVAKLDNAVWILGDDGIIYRSNGYAFVRVSTHAIEQALRVIDMTRVQFQTFEDAGHKILYITCPDGNTWGYDVATQEWHRRESAGLSRWRMSVLVKWAGVWLVGDYQHGKLYQLDWAIKDEDGTTLTGLRTTGTLVNAGNRFSVNGIKVKCDTGRGVEAISGVRAIIDPLVIYNAMDEAYVGTAVSHQYLSTGGVRPHTFSIVTGALPTGLSMDSDGLVTGTPTVAAEYAWRVRATDAQGFTADLDEGQDGPLAIDGPDEYFIGIRPPALMTPVKHYTGDRDALTPAASGVGFSSNLVRLQPGGLYCASAIKDDITANRFLMHKWNAVTQAWDALDPPDDMPEAGPKAMAWSPDGRYLAVVLNAAAPGNLIVYRFADEVLTALSPPLVGPATGAILSVAWDSVGERLAVSGDDSASGVIVFDFVDERLTGKRLGTGVTSVGLATDIAFMPGRGSRYLAGGNPDGIYVLRCTESPMTVASMLLGTTDPLYRSGSGLYWDATGGYLISVGETGSNSISVYDFDRTILGTETLTWVSSPATQPATTPSDSALSSDCAFLAVSRATSNSPMVYTVAGTPPVLTNIADPATAGGAIASVSWSDFDV